MSARSANGGGGLRPPLQTPGGRRKEHSIDPALVLRILQAARGKSLAVRDFLSRGGLQAEDTQKMKRALEELARDGKVKREGKRWRVPPPPPPETGKKEAAGKQARSTGAAGARSPDTKGLLSPAQRGSYHAPTTSLRGDRPARAGAKYVEGTLRRRPEGYGFVCPVDGAAEDVFVPPPELSHADALDGDLVRVELVKGRDGRMVGKFAGVVEQRRTWIVGTLRRRGRALYVEPSDRRLPNDVPVFPAAGPGAGASAREGQVVKVRLARGPGAELSGEIVGVLGDPGTPEAEVLAVAYAQGFTDVFPPGVRAEAVRAGGEVTAEDRAGRRDLRELPLVTIDGEDARDFDDAVWASREPAGGYRLVVAIADVTHYVRSGAALDEEALSRATSVYFPDRAIPMLPEELSNGICSLNPRVDRLCMVCDMALDRGGKVLDAQIYEGVMRSRARLTYTQVAAVLEDRRAEPSEGAPEQALGELRDDLLTAWELASKLIAFRRERGSVDFDLPEAKIVLDAEGRVVEIARRERNQAHRLVEEFMLAANEAVARFFGARGLPTVYRVHGEPDVDKLEAFAALARAHGLVAAGARGGEDGGALTSRDLNALLARAAGRPEERALNTLLLRSMMQALYSPKNIGHYGLAAPHYLHFTSPIRRYPDLIVHRLLKEHWARAGRELPPGERERLEARLQSVAAQSSERERAAMEAEREVDNYYAALFMAERIGQEFTGVVSGVIQLGMFVELDEHAVSGMVRAEDVGDKWELDADAHRLVFPRMGKAFGLGDKLRVEVKAASPQQRRIEFTVAGITAQAAVQRPGAGAGAGPGRARPPAGKSQRRRR